MKDKILTNEIIETTYFKDLPTADLISISKLISAIKDKRSAIVKTIGEFRNEYTLYVKSNFSEKYYLSVQSSFKHFSNYFGESKALNDISLRQIEQFVFSLKQEVPKGYLVYIRTLKAALNQGIEWGYIDTNLFNKIKIQKLQKNKPDFIGKQELSLILNYIKNKKLKEIIEFAFYTGCRISEILSLRFKNIDITQNLITIGDEEFITKTRKQRIIPICVRVSVILISKNIHNLNSYVFGKTNSVPYTSNYVSRKFKQACRKARLSEKIHFHSLRHSYASYLAMNGVPLNTIKELLGHTSITTTEIYSHSNIDSLKAAMNNFDRNLEDQNEG